MIIIHIYFFALEVKIYKSFFFLVTYFGYIISMTYDIV